MQTAFLNPTRKRGILSLVLRLRVLKLRFYPNPTR